MSRRQCLLTTRLALYRVFVSPLDRPQLARQLLLRSPPHAHALAASVRCFSYTPQRCLKRKPRPPKGPVDPSALDDREDLGFDPRYTTKEVIARSGRDRLPRDLEIKDPRIMVMEKGVVEGPLSTMFVLSKLLPEESLRMTTPYIPAKDGTPESFAVCKIVNKKEAYEKEREKKTKQKVTAAAGGVAPKTKEMELSWGISGGDVDTKMRQILGFLEKGMKVRVVFGKKKRGKEVTGKDAAALVAKVREGIEGAGGRESKGAEGDIGGTYRMHIEKK